MCITGDAVMHGYVNIMFVTMTCGLPGANAFHETIVLFYIFISKASLH